MTACLQSNGAQTLLLDADDTLWENNVYYERAIAKFISHLNHREYTPQQVRAVLNEVERECIVKHGYGLDSFAHALMDCFEQLSADPITPELHQTISGFAHEIAGHPMEIIAGVRETLEYLAGRHHLILLTKGHLTEQAGKIERSGLKDYFAAVEIVGEKDPPTYLSLVDRYALVPEDTWMIGNSPKSDINPALAAGLNAVFVPHAETWVLEHEDIGDVAGPGKLLVLQRFSELKNHF